MEIYLARTQGFCSGVSRAVAIIEAALEKYGAPLYVFHEIVHNTFVVDDFKDRGVVFVDDLELIPNGTRVIFSAHGVPPAIIEKAKKQNLAIIDATCPLVTKVHREASRFSKEGYNVVLIGKKLHQEIVGTSGYVDASLLHLVSNEEDIDTLEIEPQQPVAYLTQTTLSVDDTVAMVTRLQSLFSRLTGPQKSDICYATQNRQNAIKELAEICDVLIICGSPSSSNTRRLRETGERCGVPSYLMDSPAEFSLDIIKGKQKIGISSGASTPQYVVDELLEKIKEQYSGVTIKTFDNPEKKIVYKLPTI